MQICTVALGSLQGMPAPRVDPHAAPRLLVCLPDSSGAYPLELLGCPVVVNASAVLFKRHCP